MPAAAPRVPLLIDGDGLRFRGEVVGRRRRRRARGFLSLLPMRRAGPAGREDRLVDWRRRNLPFFFVAAFRVFLRDCFFCFDFFFRFRFLSSLFSA